MTRHRVGLWLVGAFGGVGTTITLGLAAMARGLADRTGLVTRAAAVSRACRWPSRATSSSAATISARRRSRNRPRNSGGTRASSRPSGSRRAATSWRRPRRGSGPGRASAPGRAVAELGHWGEAEAAADGAAGRRPHRRRHGRVRRVRVDRPHDRPQRRQHRAAVPPGRGPPATGTRSTPPWPTAAPTLLPASSLYATGRAAVRATPTSTSRPAWAPRCPALDELAESTGSLYAGKDGKTGETLMKTVLAPMFAHPQPEGHELGRPQHLRQPRRAGPRRSRPTSRRRSKPRTGS